MILLMGFIREGKITGGEDKENLTCKRFQQDSSSDLLTCTENVYFGGREQLSHRRTGNRCLDDCVELTCENIDF